MSFNFPVIKYFLNSLNTTLRTQGLSEETEISEKIRPIIERLLNQEDKEPEFTYFKKSHSRNQRFCGKVSACSSI